MKCVSSYCSLCWVAGQGCCFWNGKGGLADEMLWFVLTVLWSRLD